MQRYQKKIKEDKHIEVVEKLGNGSFGSVWLVKYDATPTVMKEIPLKTLDSHARKMVQQEISIISRIAHPNIVVYKGSFESENTINILMAYCDGGDMYTHIKSRDGVLFSEANVLEWFLQITMALMYIHQKNIIHRDLKTKNLFLTKIGLLKVGDFGISTILGSSIEMAHTVVGTPLYMSPEVINGDPYNQQCDVWSLGCCLYEMLALQPAFQSTNFAELLENISAGKGSSAVLSFEHGLFSALTLLKARDRLPVTELPSCFSRSIKDLVYAMLTCDPLLRPTSSEILKLPFIKKQISILHCQIKRKTSRNKSTGLKRKHSLCELSRPLLERLDPPRRHSVEHGSNHKELNRTFVVDKK